MTMTPRGRRILYVLVCIAFVVLASQSRIHFVFNSSPSIPLGYYRARYSPPPYDYGELVWFYEDRPRQQLAFERGYLSYQEKFAKHVVGLPGDAFCRIPNPAASLPSEPAAFFLVRGRLLGPVLLFDSDGRPLPQLDSGCRIVPVGHLFAGSFLRHSYDSRYFGLVDQSHVTATLEPLWTW